MQMQARFSPDQKIQEDFIFTAAANKDNSWPLRFEPSPVRSLLIYTFFPRGLDLYSIGTPNADATARPVHPLDLSRSTS